MAYVTVTCCKCKCEFGLTLHVYQTRKEDHQVFWCPHGHQQHFSWGKTEEDKLREERDRLKQQLAYKDDVIANERREAEYQKKRVAVAKGQVTKLKNRAAAGVCPCCNRTFQNLHRHMSSQHPTFRDEKQAADNVIPMKLG